MPRCQHARGYQRKPLALIKAVLIFLVLLWYGWGVSCTAAPGQGIQAVPAAWERLVNGVYENKGVAKIARVAKRYVLTVYCHGVHRVYIHSAGHLNLAPYLTQFVQARYTYVDRINSNVRCVRAPCPPAVERGLLVQELRVVSVTDTALADYTTTCGGAP